MHPAPAELQSLSVRRAKIADTDKVRYRVYSTPVEFIAVIAESALMAVKVSGISKPHKIVRDLPTDGIAIEAKKMAAIEEKSERVVLGNKPGQAEKTWLMAELQPENKHAREQSFKPMTLGELQNGSKLKAARILPADMLNQIIEEHVKVTAAADPERIDPPAIEAQPTPEVVAATTEMPVENVAAEPPALPELTQEEKVLQMADILPSEKDLPPEHQGLSPEEVNKLLNE